jgi:FkbM family methyltransferase
VLPNWSVVCHPEAYRVVYQAQVSDPAQRDEFLSFAAHCSDRMFLFDIGAHFGIFSLAAAHFGGRAVAVDASPTATRMIEIQNRVNGLESKVRVIRAAVSDAGGVMGMLSSGVFSYGYFKVAGGRSKSELTQVNAVTVDEMAEKFGAPTHVKVDVEGHELEVLRGARMVLNQFSPVLFLELHNEMVASEGHNPNDVLDELAQLGYDTFGFDGELISRSAVLARPISRILAKPVIS